MVFIQKHRPMWSPKLHKCNVGKSKADTNIIIIEFSRYLQSIR